MLPNYDAIRAALEPRPRVITARAIVDSLDRRQWVKWPYPEFSARYLWQALVDAHPMIGFRTAFDLMIANVERNGIGDAELQHKISLAWLFNNTAIQLAEKYGYEAKQNIPQGVRSAIRHWPEIRADLNHLDAAEIMAQQIEHPSETTNVELVRQAMTRWSKASSLCLWLNVLLGGIGFASQKAAVQYWWTRLTQKLAFCGTREVFLLSPDREWRLRSGFVVGGKTFYTRQLIKELGGLWEPTFKFWLMPSKQATEQAAKIPGAVNILSRITA